MSSNYEFAFEDVCNQLKAYSPSVVPVLEQLRHACTPQIAYNAGCILVCVHAQQDRQYYKPLYKLASTDLNDFSFFEAVKEDQAAIALFDELLRTYVREQIAGVQQIA